MSINNLIQRADLYKQNVAHKPITSRSKAAKANCTKWQASVAPAPPPVPGSYESKHFSSKDRLEVSAVGGG